MAVTIGQSAKLYEERRGLRRTQRGPGPQLSLDQNKVHTIPLSAPLPLPAFMQGLNGLPPPDNMHTFVWPHGEIIS